MNDRPQAIEAFAAGGHAAQPSGTVSVGDAVLGSGMASGLDSRVGSAGVGCFGEAGIAADERLNPLGRALGLILSLMALLLGVALGGPAVQASLTNNNYDGNIYSLYAGNGSLVPPRSTLAQAFAAHRPAVVVYYLDDDAASKQFSPVVSELQRLWGNSVELIPLVTDPLQNRGAASPGDPARYWHGYIPQVVVFDGEGRVLLDAEGQVELEAINDAVSQATGIAVPESFRSSTKVSINELNSEVVSR